MNSRLCRWTACAALLCLCLPFCGGCSVEELEDIIEALEELELEINNVVNVVQTEDPRTVPLPDALVARGDTVVINEEVTIIVDVSEQLVITELPDITLLGFENITGYDIFLRYLADGVEQGVFVFDGETLLLEYPCLTQIDLLTEDDVDPVTGTLIASYDLSSVILVRPLDFDCGEGVIVTVDPLSVSATTELIDLTD